MPGIQGGINEYFAPGHHLTLTASATITGGQIVAYTGNRTVGPAGAASMAVAGIALHNAASGEKVTVATQGVWPATATGAIAAGDTLITAAAGTVAPAGAAPDARSVIGRALEAIANGATGRCKINL
jgi:predicted RecA/RadA family phage recombinase